MKQSIGNCVNGYEQQKKGKKKYFWKFLAVNGKFVVILQPESK